MGALSAFKRPVTETPAPYIVYTSYIESLRYKMVSPDMHTNAGKFTLYLNY